MKACTAAASAITFLISAGSWAQTPSPPASSAPPAAVPGTAASAPMQGPAPVYVPAQGAPAQVTQPAPLQPPAQAYYAPPPQTYYAPPPAAVEPRPDVRLHDGFYLRMSFGVGSGTSTLRFANQEETSPEYKFSGTAAMFDIIIGGSPVPGFVIGGALVSHRILNPKVTYGGDDATLDGEVSANLMTMGLFAALYPDPRSGFNVHALLGYGETSYTLGGLQSVNNPVGLVAMGGLGYDFWIGDQWSLGPDVRIAYAKHSTTSDSYDIKATDFIPTIAFAATYN